MKAHVPPANTVHSAPVAAISDRAEAASGGSALGETSAQGSALQTRISESPRMVAQRRAMQAALGPVSRRDSDGSKDAARFGAAVVQRQRPSPASAEPHAAYPGSSSAAAGTVPASASPTTVRAEPVEARPNQTGMPNRLKAGVESLSGMDMSAVRVHRNSDKPAQLSALAYARGNEIHLGPGQEQHLPHEAWHVVQQRQGRVRETVQKAGVWLNDEVQLEREADLMGGKAALQGAEINVVGKKQALTPNFDLEFPPNPFGPVSAPPALSPIASSSVAFQLKIVAGGGEEAYEYSFSSAFDASGNPFLVDENNDNYQINPIQPGIKLKKIDEGKTYLPFEAQKNEIEHNLRMGRQQRVSAGSQKAIIDPFRAWTFGLTTRPEVAVYNVFERLNGREIEKGLSYVEYHSKLDIVLLKIEQSARTKDTTDKSSSTSSSSMAPQHVDKTSENALEGYIIELEEIKNQMMPLIHAESYRADGHKNAVKDFNERWINFVVLVRSYWSNASTVINYTRSVARDGKEKIPTADAVTTRLPWAGESGAKNYRGCEAARSPDTHIGKRGLSPERGAPRGGADAMNAAVTDSNEGLTGSEDSSSSSSVGFAFPNDAGLQRSAPRHHSLPQNSALPTSSHPSGSSSSSGDLRPPKK
jgi:hypothetical protein